MSTKHLLILVFLFSSILSSHAITYKAVSNGNWEDPIWNYPGYPGIDDDVIIDGFHVTIIGSTGYKAKSLTITNTDHSNIPSQLVLVEGSLTINGNLLIISDQTVDPALYASCILTLSNSNILVNEHFKVVQTIQDTNLGGIVVEATGSSRIDVKKDLTLEYNQKNQIVNQKLSFSQSSVLQVDGSFSAQLYDKNNFSFVFSETAFLTAEKDLTLNGYNNSQINFTINSSATSTIKGDLSLSGSGESGSIINSEINLNDGIVNVIGDITLTSNHPSQQVRLHLDGLDNTLNVEGGIKLDARDENTLFVILDKTSTLEVGNTISRPTSYGNLFMADSSLLVFNYDSISTLPSNELEDNGNDIFELANIRVVNTSGDPIELEGPMTLNFNLDLGQGILKTDSINVLILEEDATITGANEDSYIDGPIEKRGASDEIFLLPLGDKGIYGPLELSPVTDPNTVIRAEFFGDPPPIGGVPPELDRINDNQHWIIDRVAGTEPVDVVMHWMDGEQSGISDMDSITTVYFDQSTGDWVNAGRGAVTGGNATGEAGSIGSDMLGDPPPIGAVTITIGTVSTNSVLPAELVEFDATKKNTSVLLNWTTASEVNVSHFEIERSLDGIEFIKIGSHDALGEAATTTRYNFYDKQPQTGTNYYRLKTIDLDGSESLSRIVSAGFQNLDTPVAVPNPVREQVLIIGLDLNAYQAMVEIFNSTGQILFQQEVGINDGKLELQMKDVNINFQGTYFLRIVDASRTHNLTILKQ